MLKAGTSFPAVIYENDEGHHDPPGRFGKIADIMAKYYVKMDKIIQAEIKKQNEMAGIQQADNACQNTGQSNPTTSPGQLNYAALVPGATQPDIQEPLDIIKKSGRKVKQISTDFNRTDDDLKKLERENQILGMVRKNLDNMTRKFWD